MNKLKKILSLSLFLIMMVTLAFTGCSNTSTSKDESLSTTTVYPLKIVDYYNRTITLDKEPTRIITIAPSLTEIIYELGQGNKLVGRSDSDDYPKEVSSLASVGKLTNPNIEKIVELKPDVVLATNLISKEVVTKLESLNIKVVILYGEESFNGVYDTINKVGEIINNKEAASNKIKEMKQKVSDIEKKLKGASTPSVYYVIGYGKGGDYTAGKDTFINSMIEMAGGKNAASEVEGWNYSIEKLVEKNPEIMLCSNKFNSKQGIMDTNGYKDLTAVKTGKLYEIDEDIIQRQGPRIVDGLLAMAKLIHPELFK